VRRYFTQERNLEIMVTQSYSKNFGLYGERIGALNVACRDKETAVRVRIHTPNPSTPQSSTFKAGEETAV